MPRISQLQSLAAADNSDEIAIVDVSASTTKKITRGDLLKAPLPANSVTTAAIADGAVTGSKISSYKVSRQDSTTNSTLSAASIQVGFGAVTGTATNSVTKTVTFPEAFTTLPIVVVGSLGEGNPASGIGAMTGASGSYAQLSGLTTTGFTIRILNRDSGNLVAGVNYGFSWTAVGN